MSKKKTLTSPLKDFGDSILNLMGAYMNICIGIILAHKIMYRK